MRDRNTRRRRRSTKSVVAEIRDVERLLEADEDQQLEEWTDELEKEEVAIVNEGTEEKVSEGGEDQNEKAQDNWPTTARMNVAKRLVRIAKEISGNDNLRTGMLEGYWDSIIKSLKSGDYRVAKREIPRFQKILDGVMREI